MSSMRPPHVNADAASMLIGNKVGDWREGSGTEAGEDAVRRGQTRRGSWHKAAHLCEDDCCAGGPQQRALAAHVRARQQQRARGCHSVLPGPSRPCSDQLLHSVTEAKLGHAHFRR